ncbi:MAG: hypothetical protein ACFFD5_06875 [Candidatus Thorarchaeota archaeon]
MSKSNSFNLGKLMDIIFITSSIIFNISVSIVYIATKISNMELLQVAGFIVILLIIPFAITLIGYLKEKEEKKITISIAIILFYLFLELLLDYILLIPFRDILGIHIPYIIVFYAAEFCIIGVTFNKNKKMGIVVLITFGILIGCLIFMYLG